MHLEDFAQITQRVIRAEGFEEFLPTLCLPERKQITVLEGVPEEKLTEIRSIALAWAGKTAKVGEEFLLAYKEDETSFRVIRSLAGAIDERVFEVD